MKKILTLAAVATLSLAATYTASAQSETTALTQGSILQPRGSARYQALSGAMGAVGVDFSSIHQNPAGLANFRSGSKMSLSLAYRGNSSENSWYGNTSKVDGKSKIHLDELSYMASTTLGTGKNLTFAFGIQNNGRFTRTTDAFTGNVVSGLGSSLTNYIATHANSSFGMPNNVGSLNAVAFPGTAWQNPWGAVLGYTSGWIDATKQTGADGLPTNHYHSLYGSKPNGASLITQETGGATNFDIGLGLELSPAFSIGFSGTLTTLNYTQRNFYREEFAKRTINGDDLALSLDNATDLSGFGARFGLGILVAPTEGLRLGASVYTPTFIQYQMDYSAVATGVDTKAGGDRGVRETGTPLSETDFNLHTPWRFGLSAAYIFGRKAILSVDYEYQNFASTRLKETNTDEYSYGDSNIYNVENDAIKSDLGATHTVRVGLEYNATNRLSLRAGARYTTEQSINSFLKDAKREMLVPSANTVYRLPGAVESYSLGLGYRLSPKWTLDVAYVIAQQKDKVAAYPFIIDDLTDTAFAPLQYISDTQRQHNLTATISYRF